MKKIIGIDVGSTTLSIVVVGENHELLYSDYIFHKGLVKDEIEKSLRKIDLSNVLTIATTTSTPNILLDTVRYDNQISVIEAVRYFHKQVGSILIVGGEQFGLIQFEDGKYKSYKTNTSCAAGTGSFLDQQALRLNLKDAKELSSVAFKNSYEPPQIATRCSVFAKTDLIHAQQEGYKLGQISDGLCKGLTKNIVDTLFADEEVVTPLVFVGGVSKNMSVYSHLKEQLKTEPIIHELSHLYEAIGVAIIAFKEKNFKKIDPNHLFKSIKTEKQYGYEPLELKYSDYPDFSSLDSYLFTPSNKTSNVEVDIYQNFEKVNDIYMGIDIGSTSTKAIIIDKDKNVLMGLYTKTAGQPITATQAIFEAIDKYKIKNNITLNFKGVSTTGSGRKFIGKIIGADLMIDEITAHARAAYELDEEVDTIIEIGGQDAKFTTLRNGMVTSSIMNNVCAAGTGSFIEEQAQKLNVTLAEYSSRAENAQSPVSSDRCTVYMERDINHYITEGYSVNEVLASVLHSVRENYLSKVAVEANIGKKIFFQGATARNKALVAAFEQKLNKPILVSKYCHLTGGLGGAIIALESNYKKSEFKGLSLYNNDIPIENEVCTLCNNNCKIKKVTVQDDIVAFGFLCGRDYETQSYVKTDEIGFNLLKTYRKSLKSKNKQKIKFDKTVSIPASLYLAQENYMWQDFFNILGVPTVTTYGLKNSVKNGKKLAGAEFCAPMASYHGHVKAATEKGDLLFLPTYFETHNSKNDKLRQFCYYTQFAPALVTTAKGIDIKNETLLEPVIYRSVFQTKMELYKRLKKHFNLSYWSIASAYEEALQNFKNSKDELKKIYDRESQSSEDINILLLGRPYTILDKEMNKGIPDIFAKNGLKTFFQDMLSYEKDDLVEIDELLKGFHWNYAAKILESAYIASKTEGLYPVFISSFRCGPDSFALQYFKRIMDKANKPYLILELDEHDSSVGYETRIEAAIRAFKNHSIKKTEDIIENYLPVNPIVTQKLNGKTLLFPSWDDKSSSFVVALLKGRGFDVEVVPVTHTSIQKGPRNNTGQCLPVNILIESFIEYIEKNNLDHEKVVAWNMDAVLACNIRLYPYLMKTAFEAHGKGMEKVEVYVGEISMIDLSLKTSLTLYFTYMFAGMLRKVETSLRPYEINKGEVDKVAKVAHSIIENAFLKNLNLEEELAKALDLFKVIKIKKTKRPKVALLGDLYVRDNDIMNQNLVRVIEEAGGEAVTTPYNEYVRMIVAPYIKRWFKLGYYKEAVSIKALTALVTQLEKKYYKLFNQILDSGVHTYSSNFEKTLSPFHVNLNHSGESFDNLIKINELKKQYPDISLFALTNPAFCCAGAVTEAMSGKIMEETGIPVVSLNYDGTGTDQNKKIIPYIKYAQDEFNLKLRENLDLQQIKE